MSLSSRMLLASSLHDLALLALPPQWRGACAGICTHSCAMHAAPARSVQGCLKHGSSCWWRAR